MRILITQFRRGAKNLERGKWSKGLTKETSEAVARQSQSLRACYTDPESGLNSEEYREKQSVAKKKLWTDPNSIYRNPENIQKRSLGIKRAHNNPNSLFNKENYPKMQSMKNKEFWARLTPAQQEEMLANSIHSATVRATNKEQWAALTLEQKKLRMAKGINRPDARLKAAISNGKSPSKPEQIVMELLNKHFPKRWLYNGSGNAKTIIGGKIPDFISSNGQKAVIEVFGAYWHRDLFAEPEVINHYKQFGFRCLVIWESTSQKTILRSLRKFMRLKYCSI